jgi:O-antigen ligase
VAATAVRRSEPERLVLAGLAATVVMAAAGLAWAPWLTAGAVLGAALVAASLTWPAAVVTVLLFLGPLDLSFLTGGFKELFAGAGGLDMNGIRLLAVSGGLGLAFLADPAQRARLLSPTVRWYLVFLAWVGLTVAWSLDPLEGMRLLLKLAWPLLIFLTVSAPGRTRAEVERMADWVLAGAALLVVLNPLFVLLGNDVEVEMSGAVRLGGAGVGQNPFSFYLLAVALVSLGRFATRAQWRYVALAAGALTWIALTMTRITVLAGLVALAGAGLFGVLARRSVRPALVAGGVGVVVAAALMPVLLERTFGYVPTAHELMALAGDPVALFLSVNWQGRQLLWAVLVAAWAASPLVGLGLGSSSGILKTYLPDTVGNVAHNEYIRLGTDAGVLGLVLFTVAALVWLRSVVRALLAEGGREDRGLQEMALPALAVMLAWGVISLTDNAFDYYFQFTQFAGFLVAGVVVAARERERTPARRDAA